MKIALVTDEEFNQIWAKLRPEERRIFEFPVNGCPIPEINTFVFLDTATTKTEQVGAEIVLADINKFHENMGEAVPSV